MASDWFRVQQTGTGAPGDPYRPDLDGFDTDGFAGQDDDEKTPKFVVKIVAAPAVLDEIANSSQAQRLDTIPKSALDRITGLSHSKADWDAAYTIGGV